METSNKVSSKIIFEEFKTACDSIKRIDTKLLESAGFSHLATINRYRETFPLHKIVTYDKVGEICAKYGLLMANLERFSGNIPANKLTDILNFKANFEKDVSYRGVGYRTREDAIAVRRREGLFQRADIEYNRPRYYICAPKEQLLLQGNEVIKDGFMVTDDPIVLYCENANDSVYVIVTAWGEEASDENVVNEAKN